MAFRVVIQKICKDYYIGVTHNGNIYKIIKNENSMNFEKNSTYYIYANHKKGLFNKSILIPISKEEAGIVV